MGARDGGAVAGAVVSAVGDRRRKPIPAFQGGYSSRDLAVEHARGTRNPLEVVARGCRVRSVAHGDEGGSGRRVSLACARSGG